jgi:hypothetical protein
MKSDQQFSEILEIKYFNKNNYLWRLSALAKVIRVRAPYKLAVGIIH